MATATKNRVSKKVITGVTAEQYQDALSIYAQKEARADKLYAKLNEETTKLREKYDPELTVLLEEKEKQYAIVQAYCIENKERLFDDRRSLETIHGKVGFRLGTPKLKTLPKFTWDKVLEKLKTVLPDFVRTKEEVDKEGLIAGRNTDGVAQHLNAVGVYVDQDEVFFIELKKEEAATV